MPVHIYFLLYQLRSPESNNSVVATNTPSAQILASNTVLQQKYQGSMEKWLILGLRRYVCEMSLEHLGAPENKEVLKTTTVTTTTKSTIGVYRRDTGANEELAQASAGTI